MPVMDLPGVLGTLIILALMLAIACGFAAARFLAHAAEHRSTQVAETHDH